MSQKVDETKLKNFQNILDTTTRDSGLVVVASIDEQNTPLLERLVADNWNDFSFYRFSFSRIGGEKEHTLRAERK